MEQKIHEITLTGYSAKYKDGTLQLGTKESYGIEQLHVTPGNDWTGLTITAIFTNEISTEIIADENGMIEVPPEAVTEPTCDRYGRIVFKGTSGSVQRITTDLLYSVYPHAPAVGANSLAPTPNQYAQFVQDVSAEADRAEAAADRAAAAGSAVDPDLVKQFVTDYLDLNPVQPIPLDSTLSKESEAAEAKAVGDALQLHQDSVQQKISEITSAVEMLNATKQDAGNYLTAESDPTVPAWAKAVSKPGYTYSEVGAAPAGYGIGKLMNYSVANDTEINNVLVSQINSMDGQTFKRIVLSFSSTDNFTGGGGHYYTDIYKLSTNYAMITAKSYFGGGTTIQRIWYGGELQPWEWVNPPMVSGVEYRTTERFGGNPVYKKLVIHQSTTTYGTTTGYTDYDIPHGISNLQAIRSVFASKEGLLLPYTTVAGTTFVKGVDANNISIRVAGEWSAGTWYFELSYTKTE